MSESKRNSRATKIFERLANGEKISQSQIDFLKKLEESKLGEFWKALITF